MNEMGLKPPPRSTRTRKKKHHLFCTLYLHHNCNPLPLDLYRFELAVCIFLGSYGNHSQISRSEVIACLYSNFVTSSAEIMSAPPIVKATLQAAVINASSNVMAQAITAYRTQMNALTD
ncbi:hypothetical protein T310_0593 [Rasamsonia emersonii CBS 393.64]|uniref:Uncharacterized protein n=1 Tax=Rasamsonia emersonii (strain ATCC 16479 / CBS 393.64 / IMI 116815) TaxID=1408163 RepID=A0A0F4Z506_RASE3|nr:hypothetical protein T310_0593 [Rasamsonia emersonii CBS 393.64]KKA25415.1 hypothetical protein T310_0593 [Rasamsonia emersonii CBS 393.64]